MIGPRNNKGSSLILSECDAVPEGMRDGIREVTQLLTKPEKRNKKSAKRLLADVCREADKESMVLLLKPKPFDDSPMTQYQLISLYSKFGFNIIQTNPIMMARQRYG